MLLDYYPGWVVGSVGGWWLGEWTNIDNKANLSPAELRCCWRWAGLSLAIFILTFELQVHCMPSYRFADLHNSPFFVLCSVASLA